MKIDEKFIENIFSEKISITKTQDKIKLSKYEEIIPMYDITTENIFPINKFNIEDRLIISNYRFINNEIKMWINNKYTKYSKKLTTHSDKSEDFNEITEYIERLRHMIKIISNYDIDTLVNTSNKLILKFSTSSVSICKRESFHPFINYLQPYYSKIELIKLGMNMNILRKHEDLEYVTDEINHYNICNKISHNDVPFEEIYNHTNHIINCNTICDITFYSFIGAGILNYYLRNPDETMNKFYYDRIKNIASTIKTVAPLKKKYELYRFITNDDFIKDLKVGNIFIDNGFISSTRDPFYNPGLSGTFGLILIKINMMKGQNVGLFMEHFSLFPKEEEYLFSPYCKLKLKSKDENFKYYHINESFERAIKTKYEFDFIENINFIPRIKFQDDTIPVFNKNNFSDYTFSNRIDMFSKFKKLTNSFEQIIVCGLEFYVYYFDSTDSYKKFYYNTTNNGLLLMHFDVNGYPILTIEMGRELAINYLNQYYFYYTKENFDDDKLLSIIVEISMIFRYKKAKIFNNYSNYVNFQANYYKKNKGFLYLNLYNDTLYRHIKNKEKPFKNEIFYNNNFSSVDIILNKNINDELKDKFSWDKSLKELLIYIIENDFNSYPKLMIYLGLNNFNYGEFNVYEKLISKGEKYNMDIVYDDMEDDISFNNIFRQPVRRIIF